jgi:hypothetical protein
MFGAKRYRSDVQRGKAESGDAVHVMKIVTGRWRRRL